MTHHTDNDEVRRVEQMREACAKALRETADASGWKPADGAGPVETGIFFSRINALREGADLIETLPLPACATGDDAAHEGGLMARVENHLRGQVGLPPAPSRPADDAVARATERVVKAWTRMDTPGAECDLHDAVEALYEAWTDAAERAASDEKGG